MSDLIDRQAAIDAFPVDVLPWDTYCGYAAPHYVKKILEQLPSVQPELMLKQIEEYCHKRCMSIVTNEFLRRLIHGYITDEQAIEHLQATGWMQNHDREMYESGLREQRWIPVTERLPEDGTWNIFSDGETISVERYKMDAIDHFFPQGRWFSFDEAIAWMPLPSPWKGDNNG